jgi:hypothetical protein
VLISGSTAGFGFNKTSASIKTDVPDKILPLKMTKNLKIFFVVERVDYKKLENPNEMEKI